MLGDRRGLSQPWPPYYLCTYYFKSTEVKTGPFSTFTVYVAFGPTSLNFSCNTEMILNQQQVSEWK